MRLSVPHDEKSQQVPPNWLLTNVFQFRPLTLRQSKLSAERVRGDENKPAANE